MTDMSSEFPSDTSKKKDDFMGEEEQPSEKNDNEEANVSGVQSVEDDDEVMVVEGPSLKREKVSHLKVRTSKRLQNGKIPCFTNLFLTRAEETKYRKAELRKKKKLLKSTTNRLKKQQQAKSLEFVVLKADMHKEGDPDLWKVDGKSLLQKYQPFEVKDQIFYKNTAIYSGWTINSRDQYYPAEVTLVRQDRKATIVRFRKESVPIDRE